MERIALAREYRVEKWLREAYLELIKKKTLNFDELLPAEPDSNPLDRNWEANAKKWESSSRDWETLARISQLQTKMFTYFLSLRGSGHFCMCDGDPPGPVDYGDNLCKCRLLDMVDEAFGGELESLMENPEYVEHDLPRKLPLYHIWVR